MIEYLRVAYHAAQFIFGAGVIGTSVRWLYKSWQQKLEDRVLLTFQNTDRDGPWQSANGVVGEMYLKAALNDAPGFFPPGLNAWRASNHRLRVYPYALRFAFRLAIVVSPT